MRARIVGTVLIGALATGAAGALFALRRRAEATGQRPGEIANRQIRRFVTHRFDPLVVQLGLVGGRVSPWGFVEHLGRRTGTLYRTPLLPRVGDRFVTIPLTYGERADWVENILTAGHCRLQLHRRIYELNEPRIVGAAEVETLPPVLRRALDHSGRRYLKLYRLSDVEGTFSELDSVAEGAPVEPGRRGARGAGGTDQPGARERLTESRGLSLSPDHYDMLSQPPRRFAISQRREARPRGPSRRARPAWVARAGPRGA